MAVFDELNTYAKRTIKEDIDLSTMEFKPLKNFVGNEIAVDGFFFTNGKFGKQIVVVGNGFKINLPSREVEKFERIEQNDEMLNALLNGHLKLTDIVERNTRNGTSTYFKYTTC